MNSEYKNLLKYFPKLKLCYEKRFHSKVYNTEYYITVPYGKNILHGLEIFMVEIHFILWK